MFHSFKKFIKLLIPVFIVAYFWRNYWLLRNLFRLFKYSKEKLVIPLEWELVRGPIKYNEDGLSTRRYCDFLYDPLFVESYRLAESTGSFKTFEIKYRAYIAFWTANHVKHLEGDFVECGVYRGGLSRGIINYIDFSKLYKTFYLLDTFCGLEDSLFVDEERKLIQRPTYEECYEDVVKTFQDFNFVKIIRGTVPETLPLVKSDKICYLSLDMNCMQPEIAAADFFWDKIVTGGIILSDDYASTGHESQRKGFDEFAKRKGVSVLSLPTGQGLMFKH